MARSGAHRADQHEAPAGSVPEEPAASTSAAAPESIHWAHREAIHAGVISADLLGDSPGWQTRARCAQTDPEAFFPEKGGSAREAKRVCNRCEVKAECLEWALAHDERFGVWGGLSEKERKRVARRRGLSA